MDNSLKNIRAITGLSQRKFGEWLNIPLRTIEEWEAGRRNPPQYVVDLIEFKVKTEYCSQQ